jgi:hypothetical protein
MKVELSVLVDHAQFYIVDPTEDPHIEYGEIWDEHAMDLGVAVARGLIAIGTARFGGYAQVILELSETRPVEAFDLWDKVVECGISTSSGRIMVTGPEEEPGTAEQITLPSGDYSALVYFGGLDSVLDEMSTEGQDHYRVVLWKGSVLEPKTV